MELEQQKDVVFVGSSLDDLRDCPAKAKQRIGFQLSQVQCGDMPSDWKAMPEVGPGVMEIRVSCEGAFRVFYVANRPDAIYVLHVFQKTTQQTEKRDIDLAKDRLRSLG
ncbi:type II toxin-antitoxin system RelE/ParE family toxin [Pseudomonas nicosulfuronedens]|uniref:Type II toxin-antitoxin system RelE/ParE family toxin n=1 Tax=Pseudomonas nicosulfuronedens TaxID=2571105 RepID=A0A5R9QKV9_9PSED|nr:MULTISPECIES: type II toxin-antitoxin system RelE/ParE family toxin [Pseudomonas]TLX70050.1 type II toxin-antitoxin system RelE/ParE family toxin [Pseudomonas nicosulfuronedens]